MEPTNQSPAPIAAPVANQAVQPAAPNPSPEYDEKQLARLIEEYEAHEKSLEGFTIDSETTAMDEALKGQLQQLHGWLRTALSLGKSSVRQQQQLLEALSADEGEEDEEEGEGLTSVLYDQDATYLMSVLDDYRQLLEQTLSSLPADAPDEKRKAFKRRDIVVKQAINFVSSISDIDTNDTTDESNE